MKSAAVLAGPLLAALLTASLPAGAQSASGAGYETTPPFVALSLLGNDVVFPPEHLRYAVTADPGTYVTVVLIYPNGRRSVLTPYTRAVGGSKRQALVSETTTGRQSGESYLVAIATRSAFHSSNLVRQARTAASVRGAEASLNDLLSGILPVIGEDVSATYVPFRVISSGLERAYAYTPACDRSVRNPAGTFYGEGLYATDPFNAADYEISADDDAFAYALRRPAVPACGDRLFTRPFLLALTPAHPVSPMAPHDTSATPRDSAGGPVNAAPRTHPVDPGIPVGSEPAIPTPLGVTPAGDVAVSHESPLPSRERSEASSVPAQPVSVERRAPVSEGWRPARTHPDERTETERAEPVRASTPPAPMTPVALPPVPQRVSPSSEASPATPSPAPPPR